MKGYEFSLNDFTYLVKVVSRHHAKQIASWVGFTAHTRKGVIYFRNNNGNEVPVSDVYRAIQEANPEVQRWTYNLHFFTLITKRNAKLVSLFDKLSFQYVFESILFGQGNVNAQVDHVACV